MKARRVLAIFVVAVVAGIASGCTRTVVGGFEDSPGKSFRVYSRRYGALGKAYIDETAKEARVTIVTIPTEGAAGSVAFKMKASDLSCRVKDDEKHFSIDFFDYGTGVSVVRRKEFECSAAETRHCMVCIRRTKRAI